MEKIWKMYTLKKNGLNSMNSKNAAANNGFVQWLGLGFSFGKTSMIRNFVLYLLWSVLNQSH
jgi:hypothetical protein